MLKLRGELDIATSVVLEEELGKLTGTEDIIVDLSELGFIDSSGIGLLVRANERAVAQKRRFALVNGQGQVRRLLELTGISERLTVSDSFASLLAER